ncbi:hypothetical protein JHK82_047822 [Glycine max]|nr:hypothetical protein JHK82_047822 [Glycine max]
MEHGISNKDGKAKVTDFGLARVVAIVDSHATTKGDVYSFGVLVMELATTIRVVDGGEECLVECKICCYGLWTTSWVGPFCVAFANGFWACWSG